MLWDTGFGGPSAFAARLGRPGCAHVFGGPGAVSVPRPDDRHDGRHVFQKQARRPAEPADDAG